MIEIHHLSKRFERTGAAALDDLSVTVENGSFFTLLGASGCGKSTLLRCIAGLEAPDSGEIRIGGTVVFSSEKRVLVPTNRRRIGMVFQSYAIWPHMTVGANVAFPLEVQKAANIGQRTRDALALVGLAGLEDRYASRLSGGQQQRVALARAIVAEPEVLLLDEPLSNLDAGLRDQMRAELMRIQDELRMTTVYVTHDQTEALSMSDRVAVMAGGRFVEIAPPRDLYDRPQTGFAARFVGGANILQGTAVEAPAGGSIVTTTFGRLLSTEGAAAGSVEFFVRPERIVPVAAGTTGANVIACRVRAARFVGETSELELEPVGGTPGLVLRCKARSTGLPAGNDLLIRIDPADVCFVAPTRVDG